MPGSGGNGGKVSMRQFYEALLDQNRRMEEMERRILSELAILPALQTKIEHSEDEINRLRARSDGIDIIIAAISALGSLISGILGTRH